MNAIKKILATTLALSIGALSLAGCGGKKTEGTGKAYDKEVMTPGKLVVGISADYPPYESLAKYMGKDGQPIELEFKNMDFHSIITALQAGQIDVGISAFTYDPERDCLFSDTYLTSEQLVVVSKESGYKNLEDLTGKKIGAGTETTGAKAAEENIKDAKVSSPGDYTVMFEALKTGALDAVVCDGQVAKNYVAANSNLEILGDPLVKEENQIIVKNGNNELLKEINSAIAQFLASDAPQQLKDKWEIEG